MSNTNEPLPPSSPPLSVLSDLSSSPVNTHQEVPPIDRTPTRILQDLPPVTPDHGHNFPSSDTSILDRTPHVGTKAERLAIARRHGVQARKRTLDKKKEEGLQERLEQQDSEVPITSEVREVILRDILEQLSKYRLTFGDLVEFVSDPQNRCWEARNRGFFLHQGRAKQVLDWWASSGNSRTGRRIMYEWASAYITKRIRTEGNAATRNGFLRTEKTSVTSAFALGFDIHTLSLQLRRLCPTFMSILDAFCITTRQKREMSTEGLQRKVNVSYNFDILISDTSAHHHKDDHKYRLDSPFCS